MNRETESAQMRPLAKAVTKSLDHVRNLLREQCLRNKTPNSLTLNLDLNDAVTETLCESLKIFDRLFAEFELLYVSAMVQVKSKQEHEMQELICVLFSETLQRALRIGLLEQEQVDYYDPSLMFSIPRLAIVAGLVIYNKGPLNMSMPADQLSEMFRPFRTLLIKIRDLLRTLNANELYQLEKLLCTNEEIHIYALKDADKPNESVVSETVATAELNNYNCYDSDDDDKFTESNSSSESTTSTVSRTSSNRSQSSSSSNTQSDSTVEIPSGPSSESDLDRNESIDYTTIDPNNVPDLSDYLPDIPDIPEYDETIIDNQPNVWASATVPVTFTPNTPQLAETTSTHLLDGNDDESETSAMPNRGDWITADCASGYLVPNTNFGNLLQTTDTPLTDSFISSDDEYTHKSGHDHDGAGSSDANGVPTDDDSTAANGNAVGTIQTMIDSVRIQQTDSDISSPRITVKRSNTDGDSGIGTSSDQTPDSEACKSVASQPTTKSNANEVVHNEANIIPSQSSTNASDLDPPEQYSIYESQTTMASASEQYTFFQSYYNSTDHSEQYDGLSMDYATQRSSSKSHPSRSHHSYRRERCERRGCTRKHSASHNSSSGCQRRRSSRYNSAHDSEEKVSISSTSCIYSGGETQNIWQTSGRMKFK